MTDTENSPPMFSPGSSSIAVWQLFNQLCAHLGEKGLLSIEEYDQLFVGAAAAAKLHNAAQADEVVSIYRAMNPRAGAKL